MWLDCQHDLSGWFLVPSVVAGDATVLAQGRGQMELNL